MRKAFMIASLTVFAAAAFAAPRNSDVPAISSENDEVVILPIEPIEDQGTVADAANLVDKKLHGGCPCGKPKKGKK